MALNLNDFVSDPDLPDPPEALWPEPLLWRLLVRPFVYRKKTPKGIIIPDPVADVKALENITAKVMRMGSHCFRDHHTGKPWEPPVDIQVGDIVTIAKFSGQKVQISDVYMYIINCEEITGRFPRIS